MIDRLSLHDLLTYEDYQVEKEIQNKFSTFSCPKNKDLENYLKYSAIPFEKAEFSRTTIFIKDSEILGYYSLANQHFIIEENISKSKKEKLTTALGMFRGKKTIPAILIGQIGKNSNCANNSCLEKGYLLNDALNHIIEINKVMPYRVVYLECYEEEKFIKYYKKYGFSLYLDKDNKRIKNIYTCEKTGEEKEVVIMYAFMKDIKKI